MYHWGIIGGGNIAHRFMKSLENSTAGTLYAVASRTEEKRKQLKEQYPESVVFDSYDALLSDGNVDIVYIALPHAMHYTWAKKAMRAGKAVLCEKPAALSPVELADLITIAKEKHVFFMEALKTPFIPLMKDVTALLKQGEIGEIRRIECAFAGDSKDYLPDSHYMFDPRQGGALNDLASYTFGFIVQIMQELPVSQHSEVTWYREVPGTVETEFTFAGGASALCVESFIETRDKHGKIIGDKGEVSFDIFYRPAKAFVTLYDGRSYVLEKTYVHDDFFTEIEEVHTCLDEGRIESEGMSFETSLSICRLMTEVRDSLR